MRIRIVSPLAAVVASLVLLAAVGSASANHLSISSRNYRAVWSTLEFRSSLGTVRCPVTVEGSFHSSTITKVVGAQIGVVNRSSVATASCTGGRVRALPETLPWQIVYSSFEGTLPNITGVGVDPIGESYLIETGRGDTCVEINVSGGGGGHRWDWDVSILIEPIRLWRRLFSRRERSSPLRGGALCELAGEMTIEGEATATVQGSTADITIRLI